MIDWRERVPDDPLFLAHLAPSWRVSYCGGIAGTEARRVAERSKRFHGSGKISSRLHDDPELIAKILSPEEQPCGRFRARGLCQHLGTSCGRSCSLDANGAGGAATRRRMDDGPLNFLPPRFGT